MSKKFLLLCLAFSLAVITYLLVTGSTGKKEKDDNEPTSIEGMRYIDASQLSIKGRLHDQTGFTRMLIKQTETLEPEVSRLAYFSSGIYIDFKTDSPTISVRWSVLNGKELFNTCDIASRGLDLYCFNNGRWQYVNSGIPVNLMNEQLFISNLPKGEKTFRLHLPLFDTVDVLKIGVVEGYAISKTTTEESQIVFYGTSITQGTGASRPGMAYPSIVGRKLGVESINLGFSGQGRFQASMAKMLCSTDPSMFVLDCAPNSTPAIISQNAVQFIKTIRYCQPDVPILLIESITREFSHFNVGDDSTFGSKSYIEAQNKSLRTAYDQAIKAGLTNIHYLESDNLLGDDHEGTVDGTHPNDVGYMRIATKVAEKILQIQNKKDQ